MPQPPPTIPLSFFYLPDVFGAAQYFITLPPPIYFTSDFSRGACSDSVSFPGRSAARRFFSVVRCRAGAVTRHDVWGGPGSAHQRRTLQRARDTRASRNLGADA